MSNFRPGNFNPGNKPRYPLNRGLVGPQRGLVGPQRGLVGPQSRCGLSDGQKKYIALAGNKPPLSIKYGFGWAPEGVGWTPEGVGWTTEGVGWAPEPVWTF